MAEAELCQISNTDCTCWGTWWIACSKASQGATFTNECSSYGQAENISVAFLPQQDGQEKEKREKEKCHLKYF